MELVKLTYENMDKEHICCAISNNKDIQVMSKKNWLKERLDEGLVFLKGNVRGKCFIEYIPAEYAWAPIWAEGYMYIDCLWVSGQFKGHGDMPEGFVLYYTNQCPFTAKYVPILEEMAKVRNAAFQSVHIQTREDAQNAPSPFTTFSLFYDGQFVTHEILSEKKFDKILVGKGL